MRKKEVYVEEIVKQFNLIVAVGGSSINKKIVKVPELNRPGLELVGYYEYSDQNRLVLLGNKEMSMLTKISSEEQKERFEFLTSSQTPAIIVTQGHPCPALLYEIAKEKDFPVLRTNQRTSQIQSEVMVYLSERMAPSVSIHATLVEMYGIGILITGDSGIGKSELAMELIKRNHRIISDDRVDIVKIKNVLIGYSPDPIKGFMEVRGLGIIDVKKVFGINALGQSAEIKYIINLVNYNDVKEADRLVSDIATKTILNVDLVMTNIPVMAGRNLSDIVEVAVTILRLRESGELKANDFETRYNAVIK